MSDLSRRDREHIFEKLRGGLVPERGLEAFAAGVDRPRGELHRQMDLAADGEGLVKFLRGGYGCGKTFLARLAVLDAARRGFATSFVVVSDNDLHFHRFDDVYRKVVAELSTPSCPRGALGDVLDRWVAVEEQAMIAAGADEAAPDFDQRVRQRLDERLMGMTGGRAPADFVRVVQAIFDAKQEGDLAEAGALLSWLSGSANVAASARKRAGVKGEIGSRDALDYLRGVLEIVKAARYKGLVIVVDEAETILRMRKDTRHRSLNGIRQICDASAGWPGLLWVFTGTPDFFDSRHGVAGLAPLHDRVRFQSAGGFVSLRQPQLELKPFNAERLREVALRLRDLFPTGDRQRLEDRVHAGLVDRMVAMVTEGFKGDVGVVPRQFLRELVMQLDLVEQEPDYDPMPGYAYTPAPLGPEESHALTGEPPLVMADDDGFVAREEVW